MRCFGYMLLVGQAAGIRGPTLPGLRIVLNFLSLLNCVQDALSDLCNILDFFAKFTKLECHKRNSDC